MDPLTHALIGAAAAHLVAGRALGRRAMLLGAVGGVLPDVDVLIRSPHDPLLAIEYHRQFTHAVAFMPVGGAVAALPWLARRDSRGRRAQLLAAGVAAYATHGFLDAATTYGTRLLWPFSDVRVGWNWISIIDPVFTLALLAGIVAAVLVRDRRPTAIAVAFCVGYLALGAVQRERALAAQERVAQARGHDPGRRSVSPTVGNHLVWRSLYEAGGVLYTDRVRVPWIGRAAWAPAAAVPLVDAGDLPPQARADPRVLRDFERFRRFSMGWVAWAPDDPSVIGDVRYSLRSDAFDPVWGVRFHPGARVPTEWVDRSRERNLELGDLWREIAGTHEAYRPLPAPRSGRRPGAPQQTSGEGGSRAQAIVTRRAETRRRFGGAPFAQRRQYRRYANRARWPRQRPCARRCSVPG